MTTQLFQKHTSSLKSFPFCWLILSYRFPPAARGEDWKSTWSHLNFKLWQCFPTVAILQLNKEGVFIHEVIKVGDDVVVLQHGEDAYFIGDISAFLLRERIQVHLLPHHQRIVLRRHQWRRIKQTDDRKANRRTCIVSYGGLRNDPQWQSSCLWENQIRWGRFIVNNSLKCNSLWIMVPYNATFQVFCFAMLLNTLNKNILPAMTFCTVWRCFFNKQAICQQTIADCECKAWESPLSHCGISHTGLLKQRTTSSSLGGTHDLQLILLITLDKYNAICAHVSETSFSVFAWTLSLSHIHFLRVWKHTTTERAHTVSLTHRVARGWFFSWQLWL